MQDYQPQDRVRGSSVESAGVSYFASQVVSFLANRSAQGDLEIREPVLQGLIAASLKGTQTAFADLLTEVRRSRVSLAALADLYIPEAARRMGTAWHEDEMSWLDVSLGVGRMQSLLREIGTAWVADRTGDAGQGTVMLVVPETEQHTLGPMVALGQLRRYGISVSLQIAPSFSDLRNLLATRQFDGILISVANKDKLEAVAKTVKFMKTVMVNPTPVIVGGAVMAKVEDPAACTGADFSSNDVGAALEGIGLKFDAYSVLRRA